MSIKGHGKTGRRTMRRAAIKALYQLDALGAEADMDVIRDSLSGDPFGAEADAKVKVEGTEPKEADASAEDLLDEGMALALAAWTDRDRADRLVKQVAPQWPTHRQAAMDRAIIRLGCWELLGRELSPGIVINEAIELAREYSTEKSPKFVNGVLEAVRKLTAEAAEPAETPAEPADESA